MTNFARAPGGWDARPARAGAGCADHRHRHCWSSWRRSFLWARTRDASAGGGLALGIRPRLCGSGDGRRAGRLVRGDRAVPPSARATDPAHRDHSAQQGPDRRRRWRSSCARISSSRRVVARRIQRMDVSRAAGSLVVGPDAAAGDGRLTARHASRLAADLLRIARPGPVGRDGARRARATNPRELEISPLPRPRARTPPIADNRHLPLMDDDRCAGPAADDRKPMRTSDPRHDACKRAGAVLRWTGTRRDRCRTRLLDGLDKLVTEEMAEQTPPTRCGIESRGRRSPKLAQRSPARSGDAGASR